MNIIETKDLITLETDFPKLAIGDKLYEVNDLKETADKIDEIMNNQEMSDKEKELKTLELALGKANAKELMSKKLNVKSYRNLFKLILATIQGMTIKEFDEQMKSKN